MVHFTDVALRLNISENEFNFHFINILTGFDNLHLSRWRKLLLKISTVDNLKVIKTSYEKMIGISYLYIVTIIIDIRVGLFLLHGLESLLVLGLPSLWSRCPSPTAWRASPCSGS